MARKPIKKRKPRAKTPAPFGEKEARIFDIPKPPMGIAYQWVLVDHQDQWSDAWVQVPFDRHADELPTKVNVGGYIVYLGNILVQRDKQLVTIELDNARSAAVRQLKEHPAYQGDRGHRYGDRGYPIAAESFMVSSTYQYVPSSAPSIVLDVTIPLRMSAHLQDTAAALGLSTQEYLQRSISLYVRGETGGLLLPIDGAMELHQIYINDQMRKP